MAERIFRRDGQDNLVEILARDPLRRYRYRQHPTDGDNVYIEFADAEEAARNAEEALPPPPFAGLGRCIATRAGQSIPSATPTAISFDTELRDIGDYHDGAAPDRFTVGPAQGGVFALSVAVRWNESTAGANANVGDRLVQVRVSGTPLVTVRQRAASGSDTEMVLQVPEPELAAGDFVRVFALQNSGSAMTADARLSIRRISPLES